MSRFERRKTRLRLTCAGMAFGVAAAFSAPAFSGDTSLIADVRTARSLVAEIALVADLDRKGVLPAAYVESARSEARSELVELGDKYRTKQAAFSQVIDGATRAID